MSGCGDNLKQKGTIVICLPAAELKCLWTPGDLSAEQGLLLSTFGTKKGLRGC